MRASEFITESVTIIPSVYDKEKGYWTWDPFEGDYEDCSVCRGTGKGEDSYYVDNEGNCTECSGTGKWSERKINAPTLHLGGLNASYLFDMLGIEGDIGGLTDKQLPELKRKLIRLKNTSVDQYTVDPSKDQRTVVDKTGEIPQIRRSATMYNPGMNTDQIRHYIDKMLEIIDFAQKHGAGLVFA